MNRKNELEMMENRLRKAYSMTSKEQKKWQRQIEELEIMVARLGNADTNGTIIIAANRLGKVMEQRYLEVNQQLSIELNKLCTDADLDAYFVRSLIASSVVNETCAGIERALELRSIDILELKLEGYMEDIRQLGQACLQTKSGEFRELSKEEEELAYLRGKIYDRS